MHRCCLGGLGKEMRDQALNLIQKYFPMVKDKSFPKPHLKLMQKCDHDMYRSQTTNVARMAVTLYTLILDMSMDGFSATSKNLTTLRSYIWTYVRQFNSAWKTMKQSDSGKAISQTLVANWQAMVQSLTAQKLNQGDHCRCAYSQSSCRWH